MSLTPDPEGEISHRELSWMLNYDNGVMKTPEAYSCVITHNRTMELLTWKLNVHAAQCNSFKLALCVVISLKAITQGSVILHNVHVYLSIIIFYNYEGPSTIYALEKNCGHQSTVSCHNRSNSAHGYRLWGVFSFFGDFGHTGPQIFSIFIGVLIILSPLL